MNNQHQSTLLKVLLIAGLAMLAVSCQPASPTPNPNGTEIQDIRVKLTEPAKTTSKVEQFPLPNCGGTDRLAQSLGTFASVSKSATVATKGTITGGGEVGIPETTKLKLEIQVELAYQQTYESANSRVDTIEMSAAKGTHVVYAIVWDEQIFESIVQYSLDGKVYEVPYTYKLSVPKIDKSYNVSCSNNNGAENPSENISPTTESITHLLPTTTSEAVSKWGGQPSWWEKLSNTGWKLRGALTLSVDEGWRIDYIDVNGNLKSCDSKGEPGIYGPITVSVVEATLWYVPGETKCPSWTIWGQNHP